MNIGPVFINIDTFLDFFLAQPPWQVIVELFALGGWLVLAYLLLIVGLAFWTEFKESRYTSRWHWVLLAVDVPLLNIQTPKAVEQMFAHLAGALGHENVEAKFWDGFKQRYFSFEIVSIDGYIQFLIRTEASLRDLVEAAVYAQYPEAEITEVEDYVKEIPDAFPNATHEMWGADFALTETDAYPIRTHREFEHTISKDLPIKDPMSAFLESFTRLSTGEQMWFQIIVSPTHNGWKEKNIEKINEIIGAESHSGNKILDAIGAAPMKFLERVGDEIIGREASESDSHDDSGPPNKIQYLTPGQSKLVEQMELKMEKIGFKTKMRGIYVARKEVFQPNRGVSALVGAVNQFNIPSANSIAPTYDVHMSYFFKARRGAERKRRLMQAFKKRKMNVGSNSFIMNIEELATIWHFPMSYVKAPLLQKTAGKRSEPPAGLPIEAVLPPEPPEEEKKLPKPPMRFG